MESLYKLQIVHKSSGDVIVEWPPGQAKEHDLVLDLARRIASKGVGIFRTEAHVKEDIVAAFREFLLEAKRKV